MNWKLGIMLVWTVAQPLSAQDGDSPADKHGAASKTLSLSAQEEARLDQEKVLVSRHEVKQCFTAYMDGHYPRFVTSDAVLNAYHVLFEETLREQEEYQARQVRTLCTSLWKLLATADRMYVGDAAKIAAWESQNPTFWPWTTRCSVQLVFTIPQSPSGGTFALSGGCRWCPSAWTTRRNCWRITCWRWLSRRPGSGVAA